MTLEPWQWALAIFAAFLVGVSKTGIAGLGMLFVVIFTQIMPAKQATGLVLPLLIFGDIIAVASYWRHAQWRYLVRLVPWAALGVVAGYFTLGRIDDRQAKVLIGAIILGLFALYLVRRGRAGGGEREHGWWLAPLIGVLAGFTTLVANASGPLMAIYLLAMRLPKMEFVGTGAVYYFVLNFMIKAPFMVHLGLINPASFKMNLLLAPAVFLGAFIGRKILIRIDQKLFEGIALWLSAAGGLMLILMK
ncbi:MAG TPA: sulfite exporter TauE/SafE family protein [Opitutaceae bacterium]|nr:sulfite exporter TauE/SafE family protein [Opitutaceae bacterium]